MGDVPPAEASRHEEAPVVHYAVDLFNAFGAVADKAKSGVQSCQAIAAFVQERANMEAAYARGLCKAAANAKADDWAPGFGKCWALVHETLIELGKLHTASAAKMQSTMAAGAKAFAAQQEIQVQRLIAEGTKFRTAQTNIIHSMERAKEKYDRRCAEALELLASIEPSSTPNSTSSATMPTQVPSPSTMSNVGIEESKEIVGQLLNRMSSFAKPSVERQRSKLEGCLEEVIAAEKHYIQSVDYVNSKQVAIEREIAENLLAFQLTEEQRIEYLKDLLIRLQKLLLRNLEASQHLVEKLRDSLTDINEFVDIEDGFRKLSQDIDPDSEVLDPTDNPFYHRMCQVQSMSDRGHGVIHNFHTTLIDMMGIEDHFISSSHRLLRAHEAQAPSSGDLFSLAPTLSHVSDEGSTLKAGWHATKEQTHRFSQVRLEFRSLLAEPVALNIATMKQEYESARTTTHENFAKTHSSLCHDAAAHQKRQHKLDLKSREFAQLFASLPDMGEIDLRNLDVPHALLLVHQLSSTFTDKEKKIEAKLRLLGDEVLDAQQKLGDSFAILKERSSQYIQDVDMLISVYMKNEKFRLQVEKSSLLSLAKALEHAVEGASRGVRAAIEIIEVIDPTADMVEFVQAQRKSRSRTKKISPTYNLDETLKAALDEYARSRVNLMSGSPEEKKSTTSGESKTHLSPLKRTSSYPNAANALEMTAKTGSIPSDDERDHSVMASSDFQKQFKLDSPEQVVESYSCALFANNFPNHGRMYLTSDHICFSGWRDTIYVVSYLDITSIEKKNSAIIVPNALEITANGERAFFTSFVFRDECLQCILQLQAIKKATVAAMGNSVKPSLTIVNDEIREDAPLEVPSPTTEAPVTPATVQNDSNERQNCESLIDYPPQREPTPSIPGPDEHLNEFELVVDEEVPFSVNFAYNTIWVESASFFESFLENGGETDIQVSSWEKSPLVYSSITRPDTFHGARKVSYIHNKKYMVGPSSIPTIQSQRFKWEPENRLVISVTTVISDAPYCDYFRAENRWVFSNTGKASVCKLQVGISMQWVKSTWLKKQIEGTAMGEAKEYTRALVNAAIEESRKHSAPGLTHEQSLAGGLNKCELSTVLSPTASTITEPSRETQVSAVAKNPPKPSSTTTGLTTHSAPSPSSVIPASTKSWVLLLQILCLVLFVHTMYRIGYTLDQMQQLTRETLIQQRHQEELLKEILLHIRAHRNQ